MVQYRELCGEEICRELFGGFIRHQNVTKCRRRVDGEWVIRDDPQREQAVHENMF